MGQADLPRTQVRAASGKAHAGHGMVGGAVGPVGHDGMLTVRQPRHGADHGGLQRLLPGHGGEYGGKTAGKHAFSGAGRAGKQDIVAPGHGDLQRPLGLLLALYLGKIRAVHIGSRLRHRGGRDDLLPPEMADEGLGAGYGDDLHLAGVGRLRGVGRGDEELGQPRLPGGQGHGQGAADGAHLTPQAQLPDEAPILRQGLQLPRGRQDPQKDGQIVQGAALAGVRRGQIHGHPSRREAEAAAFHRGPHPFPGFPHRRIRQADQVEVGLNASGGVAFHGDRVPVYAPDPQAVYPLKLRHAAASRPKDIFHHFILYSKPLRRRLQGS